MVKINIDMPKSCESCPLLCEDDTEYCCCVDNSIDVDCEARAENCPLTPLETQPSSCDSCTHSEEQDGSNCYECVKGMADNFEARSTDITWVVGNDGAKIAFKDMPVDKAQKICAIIGDEVQPTDADSPFDDVINKTVKEWFDKRTQPTDAVNGTRRIVDADELLKYMRDTRTYDIEWALQYAPIIQTCEDAVSRSEVLDLLQMKYSGKELYKAIYNLPPISIEPCEDVVSRKSVEEMINAEFPERGLWEIGGDTSDRDKQIVCEVCVDLLQETGKLPPVIPQRKKGKWIIDKEYSDGLYFLKCSVCGETDSRMYTGDKFCPNCGAEMSGGDSDATN